ncbi:DUF2115 domain-containing protein [Methanofollis fontis]|uniref:UPF0305 protein CUJ86_02900 n=1 Tax=Methanofollis fontis TaxID=2052832 RepID=A0A483CWR8_9EURY|nr:DUF2115 domain-containing protein [Methanofollis fontis]TAJ45680.1 hypothetical protein CUJ86_02900 [Methanofollis fontis]
MSERGVERIRRTARRIGACTTRGELGSVLGEEAGRYTLHDLQRIGGGIKREVDPLPEPYRSQVRPYFEAQIFGAYHRLMHAHRSGSFRSMDDPIADPDRFKEFAALIEEGCLRESGKSGTDFGFSDPLHSLFYYLVTGYLMFVENGPGHPVGTPFPGGFVVEQRGDEYFCPIRDKEQDVPFSICNVCPAHQMEGV